MHDSRLQKAAEPHHTAASAGQTLTLPRAGLLRAWSLDRAARLSLATTLLVALLQGLLYLTLLPPWQHYDEPTHFEYAWLIANRTPLPRVGDEDATMRREVAASMLTHRFFYRGLPQPDLLAGKGENIWIGISELGHPPAYYTLVSLPLRLVPQLDVTSQLYVARAVSLVLFLLTIAVAWGLVRDLTPSGSPLRWAAPLAVALLPPFADIMTSVNNDVGAVLCFSLFLWGCVRAIRYGLTWRRAVWVIGVALLGVMVKNTAAVALLLTPLLLGIALWLERGWRWRWLLGGTLVAVTLALTLVFSWGDAAYWYRWNYGATQPAASRVQTSAAPVGTHAIQLEMRPDAPSQGLANILQSADTRPLAGNSVTVGAWIWADQPVVVFGPGPIYATRGNQGFTAAMEPHQATTTPTFVSQTLQLPANANALHALVQATVPASAGTVHVYVDGLVIAPGAFPTGTVPIFDDASAHSGSWGGQRFTNLARNPSGEQAWPHLRPWIETLLFHYIHRSPSQTIAALLDVQRIGAITLGYTLPNVITTGFGAFAWGQVRLQGDAWTTLFEVVIGIATLGAAFWLVRRWRHLTPELRGTLIALSLTAGIVWLNTLLRPLPFLDTWSVYPTARYGFPAIIPSVLAVTGGWLALWPARWQRVVAALLIVALIGLNVVAALTIHAFYAAAAT